MIVTVNSVLPSKSGGAVWWMIDIPHVRTLPELHAALARDGSFEGIRLEGEVRDRTEFVVSRETPMIVGQRGIVSITPPHLFVVDTSGAAWAGRG